MADNKDLEEKLKLCAAEIDQCAALIKTHEIEPVKDNLLKLSSAIADISEVLICFEGFREQIARPWKNRCSFCKKDEDHVDHLIAGPAALICNECVEVCENTLVKLNSEN